MRKSFLALLLASFAALSASSASAGIFPFPIAVNGDDVTVAVAADAAWLSGQARKQVSTQVPSTEVIPDSGRHRLSRIDWDLKNVFLVGGAGSIRTCRLSLNGGIWVGADIGGSGAMEERYWPVDGTSDAHGQPANGADGFSRSDATVTGAIVADGNVAFDLLGPDNTFALYPFAGFRLDRYEWEAENGWNTGPENGWIPTGTYGKNLEYRLDCVQAYAGLGSSWLVGRRFWLSAYGRFAPVYRAKDHEKRVANHRVTETRTDRNWFDDIAFGLGVRAEWALTPHCWLAASVDWSRCTLAEGKNKVLDSGEVEDDAVAEEEEEEEEEEKPKKKSKKDKDDGKDALSSGLELENLAVSLGIVWRF
jgi:outer membrane protease